MQAKRKMWMSGVVLGAVALMAASLPVRSALAVEEDAKVVTITGELIDTGCYIAGGATGTGHATCGGECLASGVPAGILPEGKGRADLLFLLTNPRVVSKYVGQTIKVEGVVHADVHAVDVKKLSVKDGEHWKDIALKDAHHGTAEAEPHEHKHGK